MLLVTFSKCAIQGFPVNSELCNCYYHLCLNISSSSKRNVLLVSSHSPVLFTPAPGKLKSTFCLSIFVYSGQSLEVSHMICYLVTGS
jgi:hypothetical protein